MFNFINTFFPKMNQTTITLSKTQWEIIMDAVEDYGVLVDEEKSEEVGEILDIIEAEMIIQS